MLIPFLGSLLLVLVDFAEHSLSSYSYHFEFTDPWNVLLSYLVQICAQTKDWIHTVFGHGSVLKSFPRMEQFENASCVMTRLGD